MNKNLFYVAQYFTPEPYLKDLDFIKALKDKGYNPVVITGFPNYPNGVIYKGYKNKVFHEEILGGIRVIRVYTYADHSLNGLKRALNYFVFGFFAALAIFKYGKKNSFYYILQSSPFVVFCAWMVKLFKPKSKILLDIQDVFPENIRVSGFIKSKRLIGFLDFVLNNFYYNAFDMFVTVSESFKKIISEKKIPFDKILTLYNWSMVEKKQEHTQEKFNFKTNGINIVYAGNIGVHQGLSKLSDGIINITNDNPNIFFHFFGDGTDFTELSKRIENNGQIILHGRVSSDEIGKFLEDADVLFLHLIKDPIYECIIPSKLQAYIEVGKPILAGIEGEARDFITQYRLGEVFQSENIADFVKATLKISLYSKEDRDEIQLRSINLYQEKFSRQSGVNKVDEFIRKNT